MSLRDYFLPEVNPELIRFLQLRVRTQNCLRQLFRKGNVKGLGDLHNHTVGELLKISNFGMKSLFDLLEAIQSCVNSAATNPASEAVSKIEGILSVSQVDNILATKIYSASQIGQLCLPTIAASAKFKNLHLKLRTRGCLDKLVREGVVVEATDLSKIAICRLLRTSNFGRLTFIDLLSGLRCYMVDVEPMRSSAPVELLRLLEKLRNSSLCAKIRCNDPRFRNELLILLTIANSDQSSATVPNDSLTELAAKLSTAAFSTTEAKRALIAVRKLRQGIRRALHIRLECELFELVRSELDERTVHVVSRVYGLDGRGGTTLQGVANEYHLTRERIRQICDRVTPLVKLQTFLPKLEACLKLIASRLPNRADNIEKALMECRLTQTEFRLEGIRMAAELFNKAIRFDVTEINGVRIAVMIRRPAAANKILSMAYRSVSKSGVCTVLHIAETLHEERESVVGVLSTKSTVRWLGQEREWFLITDSKHNRLFNLVAKIMAVTPRIPVGELRHALSRNPRLRIVPPRTVLAEFCRERGWRVEGDIVTSTAKPLSNALSCTEKKMIGVLKQHGPVLYRTEFQELCAANGISRNTCSMYMGRNSIISRVSTGVYALTGSRVGPLDVENCLRRNRASAVTLANCGWTLEARPWIALQMSPAVVASGVFAVPTSIREFLLGGFLLELSDGTEVGKVQVTAHNSWGLGTLIRRWEVEPGDFIVLEFNLQARRAKAFLGGAELVESFNDAEN